MKYGLDLLYLLSLLERYVPYMSDAELMAILEWGIIPDAYSISMMEMRRIAREKELKMHFSRAYSIQK